MHPLDRLLPLAGTAGPNMIELWRWEMQPGEAFTSPGHPATTFELLHVEAGALTLTLAALGPAALAAERSTGIPAQWSACI